MFIFNRAYLLFIFLQFTFLENCNIAAPEKQEFTYDIKKPDEIIELPKKLAEVSGLSFINDQEVMLIQDEKGLTYTFNLIQKEVTGSKHFAGKGDYEDIKVAGNEAYVLESNGTLHHIHDFQSVSSNIKVTKYKTALTAKNDTEGLCYDKDNNRLLIACKAEPGINGKDYHGKRAIYEFDLATKKLNATPVYLIDQDNVGKMEHDQLVNGLEKFVRFYGMAPAAPFQPSGIAIHPVSKDLYIISSVGNLLVILQKDGKIKNALSLPGSLFIQPEGIAFDSKGTLFISNEGKKGKGNILKFSQKAPGPGALKEPFL